jgi:hypothetical protein
MNSENDAEQNQPNNLRGRPEDFIVITLLAHLAAELQVHRELLYTLLDKTPEALQGKTPKEYVDTLVQDRTNRGLAGVADLSPQLATLVANVLLPRKKDEPPTEEP